MHVDSQLSSLLFSLINHYQVIELSGVGTIKWHQIPAKFVDMADVQHIIPPQFAFLFTADQRISANTLLKARSEELLSDTDYSRLLTFVNELNRESKSTPSIVIERVQSDTDYLPQLELKEYKVVNDTESSPKDKEVHKAVSVPREVAINSKDNTDQFLRTLKTNREVVSIATDDKSFMNYLLPLLLLAVGIILLTFLYKQCDEDKVITSQQDVGQKELTRAEDDIDPLTVNESIKIFDNPRLEKYKHVLTQDVITNGCKITVGSFKDKTNATNMMERVLTEGYNSEIVSFEAGSRVIITFDCLSEDLDAYLTKVKEIIAPNAWYLEPRYEPEVD